jgi:hypothetical protein
MTESSQAPRAGWYPDPHAQDQMRFWDGSVWTEQTFAARQANTPVGYRFALLAQAVRAGLILSLAGGIGEVVLYAWGLSMFDDAFATSDVDRVARFDDFNAVLSIGGTIVYLVTCVLWVIWQYQLANSIADQVDRSPGWHLGSWFIPFANLVMPFQNIRDLWRKLISPDAALVGWWWAATLASGVALRISLSYDSGDGLGGLKSEVRIWLLSSVVGIVSAVLALVMVRKLTMGGLRNSASGGRSGLLDPPGSVKTRHLPKLRQRRDGLAGPNSGTPRPF